MGRYQERSGASGSLLADVVIETVDREVRRLTAAGSGVQVGFTSARSSLFQSPIDWSTETQKGVQRRYGAAKNAAVRCRSGRWGLLHGSAGVLMCPPHFGSVSSAGEVVS